MSDKKLYFGDNLKILQEYIPEKSVDLIYLDPPFNSKASYNVLFKEPTGELSKAQITAFDDTWHWTQEAERAFQKIVNTATPQVVDMMSAFRQFIKRNDMLAYLTMMTIRLLELHRVLKSTGSIYLHCDSTASHYLKIVMDAIFGFKNFNNEIIWHYRRWPTKTKRFQRMHDVILFYSKTRNNTFNTLFQEPTESSLRRWKGKKQLVEFNNIGGRLPTKELEVSSKGVPMDDVWDISIIAPSAKERLGYPTQKPKTLLMRIIEASSLKHGIVLDPFCGCGTTISACEHLNKNKGFHLKWIGIDVTHLAINLIKWRLKNEYNLEAGKDYIVVGEPEDLKGAVELANQNRFQFQWWALSLLNARPYKNKQKGVDTGIDGYIYFLNPLNPREPQKIIIQVKSGGVQVKDIRDLKAVIGREKASMGVFVTLKNPTKHMIVEAAKSGFYQKKYPKIQILTTKDLLSGKQPQIPTLQLDFRKKAEKIKKIEENLKLPLT